MFNLALRVLCFVGELMLKCVLAKPCNPLCDQESMRFEVDWVIPEGLTALGKRETFPVFCFFLHVVK